MNFNASKKSLEFAVDIGEEIIGVDDEYDGVWGTLWGSWEDNVLGAAGEEGVVQHLFGEEGVGGGVWPGGWFRRGLPADDEDCNYTRIWVPLHRLRPTSAILQQLSQRVPGGGRGVIT